MKKSVKRAILLVVVAGLIVGLRFTGIGAILTLENVQKNADKLLQFSNQNYVLSVLAYVVIYILVTGFSLPGATVLTLAGGFLYKALLTAVYVNVAATIGATLAFIFARYIAGQWLQEKYAEKLAKFNKEFENNGARYLLTMRFIPIFPFFLINVFAGLTRVPMRTFFWTTSVGIFPGTLIYAYAGQQLRTIKDAGDIFSAKVLVAFLLLAGFALIPIIVGKARAMKKENHVSGDLENTRNSRVSSTAPRP